MVEVYSNHVNLTTEFSRRSHLRRIPYYRQILSSSTIFSEKFPFRSTTTSPGTSKVSLFVSVNHAPFQQARLCHTRLSFSTHDFMHWHTRALRSLFRHVHMPTSFSRLLPSVVVAWKLLFFLLFFFYPTSLVF